MSSLSALAAAALVLPLLAHAAPPAALLAPTQRVATPAGELAVRAVGRGPTTLLLWHALYADASMWAPLAARLGDEYRLLIVDAPGHGASGLPEGPLTMAASGAALLAVLDAFGAERAAVVGCSWGGIGGVHAAAQAPQRIVALAAFNTPFGAGSSDLGTRTIVWMTGWMGDTEFFGRRVASGFFSPATHAQKPELVDAFVAVFPTRDSAKLQSAARAVLIERDSTEPLLPRLQLPVLVVAGADDERYPAADAQAAAAKTPGAKFMRVADSAHLTPLEQPDLAAQLIRELVPPR